MKRNLIIGTVAAFALAAPAGVYAASSGQQSSIDHSKVEQRDVVRHDPSPDRQTAWRADDMKSADTSRSDGSGTSGESHDKASSDGSWSGDGQFDR